MLHRDIKPANLLIDRAGSVWITDFGLARFSGDSSLTGTNDVVGTLRYMSPEQALARRGVVDQRTDVYALGATLYEVLTLRPAFKGRDHQELLREIALDEPTPPRRLNASVPRDLETIVLKAMAKDPSGRYATAQELAEDLKRFLKDDPIRARRPGPFERTLRWARRRWELVATSAAILMLSLLIGAVVIWHYARQTAQASHKYRNFIVKHFPLVDRSAVNQIMQADELIQRGADPASRARAFQWYDQVLKIFREASELPPTDNESRIVIARALCRLAYTQTMLAFQKGSFQKPETKLMAEAGGDFRRSVAEFEKLLDEQRGDRVVRRYLADALGLRGMGCFLRFTHCPDEAEQFYSRAIELRRDLVRGDTFEGVAESRPRIDDPDEQEDPSLLIYTVQAVSLLMENAGRKEKVEKLYHQLENDLVAVAARFSGPEFKDQRLQWGNELMTSPTGSYTQSARSMTLHHARTAITLSRDNAVAHNNAAWALASAPDDPWFNPKEGLAEARRAIELDSKNGTFLNTLGVAAFRARDWATAHDALKKSIHITGGTAHDWFFLAMTAWNQGNRHEARQCFDTALSVLKGDRKDDPELLRFHAEAAALMGLPGPKAATAAAEKSKGMGENTGH
jgi:tetratricopeptide (TPR) repeat protein